MSPEPKSLFCAAQKNTLKDPGLGVQEIAKKSGLFLDDLDQ